MAGAAFTNEEVVKLAEKFVPVLVDGDEDKEFGSKYGVRGYPNTVFVDPRGKKVSHVTGAVPTDRFLDEMKAAVKKIGPVQLKKAAKELEEAAGALAKAREKGDWKAALKSAAAIEKIGREGPVLEAARQARKDAAAEGEKRVAAAKELRAGGKRPESRSALAKVASEFPGTDAADEAKRVLKEMDAEDAGREPGNDGGDKGKDGGK